MPKKAMKPRLSSPAQPTTRLSASARLAAWTEVVRIRNQYSPPVQPKVSTKYWVMKGAVAAMAKKGMRTYHRVRAWFHAYGRACRRGLRRRRRPSAQAQVVALQRGQGRARPTSPAAAHTGR